ncbi:MAG TPA: hypothetical protein VJB60_01205 [Candidatus Peribacterales bacterium]|nr:hypothetical protein [Candidatus Peribacterales bacterium]
MRYALFILFFLPATALAATLCYSPSDCASPKICSSLIDAIYPGQCVDKPSGGAPLIPYQDAPMESASSASSNLEGGYWSVPSSASSASSGSPNIPKSTQGGTVQSSEPGLAEVEIISSSSSQSSEEPDTAEENEKSTLKQIMQAFVYALKNMFCFSC